MSTFGLCPKKVRLLTQLSLILVIDWPEALVHWKSCERAGTPEEYELAFENFGNWCLDDPGKGNPFFKQSVAF